MFCTDKVETKFVSKEAEQDNKVRIFIIYLLI